MAYLAFGILLGLAGGVAVGAGLWYRPMQWAREDSRFWRETALIPKEAIPAPEPAAQLLEPEEVQERSPKRLREPENRNFWS